MLNNGYSVIHLETDKMLVLQDYQTYLVIDTVRLDVGLYDISDKVRLKVEILKALKSNNKYVIYHTETFKDFIEKDGKQK